MNKNLSRILMIVLALVIVYLVYTTTKGIQGPIEFDKESKRRYEEVERKLDAIRTAQFTYKEATGKYAKTWDSLVTVLENDSLTVQRKILVPRDQYDKGLYGANPKLADDTTKYEVTLQTRIAIRDTLPKTLGYPVNELSTIPFSDGAKFYLNADIIEVGSSKIKVPVFMVTAPNKMILKGLETRFFEPDYGYQLGSLIETTTEYAYKRESIQYE